MAIFRSLVIVFCSALLISTIYKVRDEIYISEAAKYNGTKILYVVDKNKSKIPIKAYQYALVSKGSIIEAKYLQSVYEWDMGIIYSFLDADIRQKLCNDAYKRLYEIRSYAPGYKNVDKILKIMDNLKVK